MALGTRLLIETRLSLGILESTRRFGPSTMQWAARRVLMSIALVSLLGCRSLALSSDINQLYGAGRHDEVIVQVTHAQQAPDYNQFTDANISSVLCFSYFAVRNYAELENCSRAYLDRIDQGRSANPNFARGGVLHGMMALTALELGEFERAVREARAALAYTSGAKENVLGKRILQDRQALGDIFARQTLALDAHRRGAQNEVVQHIRALERVPAASGSVFSDEVRREKGSALASLYFTTGAYEKVLPALKKGDRNVAFDVFMNVTTVGWYSVVNAGTANLSGIAENTRGRLSTAYMLAKLERETGDQEKAIEAFRVLHAEPTVTQMPGIYRLVCEELSAFALERGDRKSAIDYLRQAVDTIERQRSTVNREVGKIGFIANKQTTYERLVALLVEEGRASEALRYAERAKSRALVDILAEKRRFVARDADIPENIEWVNQEVTSVSRASLVAPDEAERRTRGIRRKREQIEESSPDLASLVVVGSLPIPDIQRQLAADETLIEYFGDADTLHVFVVDRSSVKAIRLSTPSLTENVKRFRADVQSPSHDDHRASGAQLHRQLIAPVLPHAKHERLVIVPHGPLHYLPFGALSDDNTFLADRYRLRILPAASVMRFLGRGSSRARGLFAIGNPDLGDAELDLPAAEREARAIVSTRRDATARVGANATETALRREGSKAEILHIASHGEFDESRPLESRLLLAGDDRNDGNLTVGELYDLRMNARLVTLSACETGLGDIRKGDDVIGLTRGFLYAGADAIVSSLWKVDDAATAELMVAFYRGLETHDTRDALWLAQRKIREEYHPHPFYWSAFQLTGQ